MYVTHNIYIYIYILIIIMMIVTTTTTTITIIERPSLARLAGGQRRPQAGRRRPLGLELQLDGPRAGVYYDILD